MNFTKKQSDDSIKFFKKQMTNDIGHSSEYKTAIDALIVVEKINDIIAELEKRDKENWDKSITSNYCWGASKAFETSASLLKSIFKDT